MRWLLIACGLAVCLTGYRPAHHRIIGLAGRVGAVGVYDLTDDPPTLTSVFVLRDKDGVCYTDFPGIDQNGSEVWLASVALRWDGSLDTFPLRKWSLHYDGGPLLFVAHSIADDVEWFTANCYDKDA